MKGSSVYDKLKGKCELAVLEVLTAMAEDQVSQKQQLIGVAHMVDKLLDIIAVHATIIESQRSTIDELKQRKAKHDKSFELVNSEEISSLDEEIKK